MVTDDMVAKHVADGPHHVSVRALDALDARNPGLRSCKHPDFAPNVANVPGKGLRRYYADIKCSALDGTNVQEVLALAAQAGLKHCRDGKTGGKTGKRGCALM